ncbi:hypothetical protein LDENG_00123260, partial [Lucifuga dentata]
PYPLTTSPLSSFSFTGSRSNTGLTSKSSCSSSKPSTILPPHISLNVCSHNNPSHSTILLCWTPLSSFLSIPNDWCQSCNAPWLCNSLPQHIRQLDSISSFKSHTKTYLFKLAFSL